MLTSVVHAIHNSARSERDAGRRFQHPIAPSISAPRNLPRPPRAVDRAGFLIANPRLEILTSPTKQTIGAKSNRERIAFSPHDSSRHPSAIEFRFQISNRNNRIIRNSPKRRRNNTYAFSNRNKSTYSGIFAGSALAAGGLQTRPVSSQQNVRQPGKSGRIQKEMAVSPQALGTQSTTAQDFIDSVNPATGEVVARIPTTPLSAIPAIFEAAHAAQKEWAARSLSKRCAMLRKLRDAIFERRDDIANIVTRETGKPRAEAILAEILLALDTADFLARQAPRWLRPERVPHHNIALKAKSGWLEFEPHGVVAIISPWNFPFAIPMTELIPALVAGNSVLLKPSELTPATGALVGELIDRAGFPKGLVQILQGGGELGAAIIEAGPAKVFFTGSVATGRRIAEACASKLIPSVLELGGKDAMIVLADADLDVTSSAAVWGGFTNCGQACLSVERIYVEQPVAEKFTELCVEKTRKLRLGSPADPEVDLGPMIRERQLERVEQQLRDAQQRGARILTGGHRRADLGPNFLEPTVVTQVDHSMQLMRDETFGPVLAIRSVASADEAIALANDSPFCLSASIWTRNARRGRELASRIRAGSVMINDVASYYGISEAPHGGSGFSGWGRTHSRLGLLEMVQVKYVDADCLPLYAKPWWYGYSEDFAAATGSVVELMFAPSWKRRLRAMVGKRGARGLISRRRRI
jgi:acyl-CoA reductase-like NAD-dependent aldehyde dehydrogenase